VRSAIVAWLRRARTDSALVLRGSVMMRALSPRARVPEDVDLVVTDDATLDVIPDRVRALAGEELTVERTEVLWPDSPVPGIRVVLAHASGPLQVDLALREPMTLPPRAIEIPEVGEVLCVRPEDLYGWKLHGMVEFGHGQWRPKDLYDLDVLGELPMDREAVRVAIAAAFASRKEELSSLDDFLTRPAWGEGRSNRRRWRRFVDVVACDDFPVIRDRVRAAVRTFRENPESPEYAEYPE
jgi:hypothetical protein